MKNAVRNILLNRRLWNPQSEDATYWIDASDSSTIQLSGSSVLSVTSKSSVNRVLTASGTVNIASGTNNKSVLIIPFSSTLVNFDLHNIGTKSTIAIIIKNNSFSGSNNDYITGSGSNNVSHIAYSLVGANFLTLFSGVNLFSNSVIAVGETNIIVAVTDGANSFIRLNGNTVAQGNAGSQSWINGLRLSGASPANADYSEVLILPRASDLKTIENIEGYFAHGWNLSLKLPQNHPFYFRPPFR